MQALAFAQARDHAVEPGLELADLAAVVDRHLGVEVAVLHLLDAGSQGADRVGDRARREHRNHEADRECDTAEDERRLRQLLGVEVLFGEGRERDQQQAENGDGGPQRPGEKGAGANARRQAAVLLTAAQCPRCGGSQLALAEEIDDRAHGQAREQDGDRDPLPELARVGRVQHAEDDRRQRPQHRMDQGDRARCPQDDSPFLGGGRPAGPEPLAPGPGALERPHRSQRDADRKVDRKRDPAHQPHLAGVLDLREREDEGAEGEDDAGAEEVRDRQRDRQRQSGTADDRGPGLVEARKEPADDG